MGGAGFVSLEDATGPVVVDLSAGIATGFGTDTISQVEGVVGSAFGDVLTGNSSANDILGFGGDDLMFGMGGFDYVRFDLATTAIFVDLAQGLVSGEGSDAFTGFEGIVGSNRADFLDGKRGGTVIFGLKGGDSIAGLGGDDELFGMGGADFLLGGKGNDELFGGGGADTCIQGAGTGVQSSC